MTSVSAYDFVSRITGQISKMFTDANFVTIPVVNVFFGESVTVAGLLTAKDVIRSAWSYRGDDDVVVVIPGVMFNYKGYTLDGYSSERIARSIGMKVMPVDNSADLLSVIENL